MKTITIVTLGASPVTKEVSADTIRELASEMNLGDNLQVKVNGDTASYDDALEEYSFVTFGEKIKGGL